MSTAYIVIPALAAIKLGSVDWPDDPGLERIRDLVVPLLSGGDLERVRVWHNDIYTDMFVDENFIDKSLPANPIATDIYRANTMAHVKPTPDLNTLPHIHGTAVLFLRPVWF